MRETWRPLARIQHMQRALTVLALAATLVPALPSPASADAQGDFKRGDLAAAVKGWSAAIASDPKDADALLGLARIRLYEDRRKDAARLANAASAASPSAAAAATKILTEVKRRDDALDPANVTLPKEGAHVPFAITDPLPILKVRVNDKADAYFLLDTGAPTASLDPAFASELGIATEDNGTGTFLGGKTATIKRATLSSLTLGSATIRNLPVALFPTRGFDLDARYRLDGVIGTGVLYRFLSTIDYPHGELVLRPRDAAADFERRAAESNAVSAPMWLVGDHFIFIQANVNDGPERLFNVDTGAAGVGIMPSPATVADSHITLDTAHATEATGGGGKVKIVPFVATVRFATIRRTAVPGSYTPDGSLYGLFPFEAGGSLSHLVFRPYAMTFDFVAMKLFLAGP
jgi:hypothetical protein